MFSFATRRGALQFVMAASFVAITACGSGDLDTDFDAEATEAVDSTGKALGLGCAPHVDAAIAVPAGNRLSQVLDATGVQIYACQANATGYGWVFQAPEADLFNSRGRGVGNHYAGPTWEYRDGSKVMAARVAGVTPDPASIPWLLLQASGHEGHGKLDSVTYIQRLDTTAGLAPAAASCDASHVGEVARVGYTATYYFYEAGRPPCGCR